MTAEEIARSWMSGSEFSETQDVRSKLDRKQLRAWIASPWQLSEVEATAVLLELHRLLGLEEDRRRIAEELHQRVIGAGNIKETTK